MANPIHVGNAFMLPIAEISWAIQAQGLCKTPRDNLDYNKCYCIIKLNLIAEVLVYMYRRVTMTHWNVDLMFTLGYICCCLERACLSSSSSPQVKGRVVFVVSSQITWTWTPASSWIPANCLCCLVNTNKWSIYGTWLLKKNISTLVGCVGMTT